MTLYNVSFKKNGVYQTNLIETDKSPVDVGFYYRDIEKTSHVFNVDFATEDDDRPGKQIIRI